MAFFSVSACLAILDGMVIPGARKTMCASIYPAERPVYNSSAGHIDKMFWKEKDARGRGLNKMMYIHIYNICFTEMLIQSG